MEGRRELPAGQLELRPLRHHCRCRRRAPRTRSGEPAPPLRTRTHAQAAPSFVLLLRRPRSALAHGHIAHRLLGGRLLLRAHDRAHPDCVLRAGSDRRRRSVAPAAPRISGQVPALGPALSPPRALLVRSAGRRALHRQSVDGPRSLQPGHGALARSGPLRRRRGEPIHPHRTDARQPLRHRSALLAADHPLVPIPHEGVTSLADRRHHLHQRGHVRSGHVPLAVQRLQLVLRLRQHSRSRALPLRRSADRGGHPVDLRRLLGRPGTGSDDPTGHRQRGGVLPRCRPALAPGA